MNIPISNHPQFENVERIFEFKILETDLVNFAKLKGFVKCFLNGETPKGFNPNGEYKQLIADNTTLVNSQTGEYSLQGDTNEIDFIKNMNVTTIASILNKEIADLKVVDILEYLVVASVEKQDRYKRFDK